MMLETSAAPLSRWTAGLAVIFFSVLQEMSELQVGALGMCTLTSVPRCAHGNATAVKCRPNPHCLPGNCGWKNRGTYIKTAGHKRIKASHTPPCSWGNLQIRKVRCARVYAGSGPPSCSAHPSLIPRTLDDGAFVFLVFLAKRRCTCPKRGTSEPGCPFPK